MKKVFALFIGLLFIASCEQDTLVPEIEEINIDQTTLAKKGVKVDVCHKGKIINVSVNAVSSHQGHGDAIDMDGDGYFDIENDCSEIVDCDDYNAEVNSAMEEVCDDGIDNNCNGEIDENCVPEIGDFTQGGIVFYIAPTPTDLDGDGTLDTGLVCAVEDQGRIRWYNGTYVTTGATGTAIGTGSANTDAIINVQGATATSYAAGLARAFKGGGYTDWFLPSRYELAQMYGKSTAINTAAVANGGAVFSYYSYWSSTESSFDSAWNRNFLFGSLDTSGKYDAIYVRAVRAF